MSCSAIDAALERAARARLARIDIPAAARRIAGEVKRTRLLSFSSPDPRVELRLKLECEQRTNAFKARGAANQIALLSEAERAAGVVTTSSGNHGKALAWAAEHAGVPCTVFMPANAYLNKVQACRDHGAEVVLAKTREEAERLCRERVEGGAILVHPYDSERTIEGAGTVGLEIAQNWPTVELVIVPVGGGGLIAGCALALDQALGGRVRTIGAEPEGAPTLSLAIEKGEPVVLAEITTEVQGLCPPSAGLLNTIVALDLVDGVVTLTDPEIFAAQRLLVRAGHVVEPAGAASLAVVTAGGLPPGLIEARNAADPLRVCCVISGGNPDPAQLESVR